MSGAFFSLGVNVPFISGVGNMAPRPTFYTGTGVGLPMWNNVGYYGGGGYGGGGYGGGYMPYNNYNGYNRGHHGRGGMGRRYGYQPMYRPYY